MNSIISAIGPSASVQLMAQAKEMRKSDPTIIGLAGGEPDFDTPPRITLSAIRSLINGNTHYALGPGMLELRAAIAQKLKSENGIECSAENILITPGGKNAIYLAVRSILNHGEAAMILDPSWVSYEPIVLASGGIVTKVKLEYSKNYEITEEQLERTYTDNVKLLIINYPNNPTGRILHEHEASAIEAFLLRHPNVYLLSDEIYESIIFDKRKNISMASRSSVAERVITVNGFSKCAAMTGWRIGYMAAAKPVFDTAYKLYQHSLTCMNGFIQAGALAAFECQEDVRKMVDTYRARRDMFVSMLNDIRGVECKAPEGAFYAWVRFDMNGMNSNAVAQYLLEKAKVVGVPGVAYGEENACCLRFSFAADTEMVRESALRIKRAVEGMEAE